MDFSYVLGLALSGAAVVVLLKIVALDIILSGDNAVVIAMATRNLPAEQQNKAIFWGTAGAVILRILFAAVIVYLLKLPFVNIVGGLLLLWIAYKVLVEEEGEANIKGQSGVMKAIGTIVVADAVMSLDNVVAVAGAANGHLGMIAIGVLISIPIMIFGSKMIVKLMDRYKWIAYAGAGILAWTAGEMLLKDDHVNDLLSLSHGLRYIIAGCITVIVLVLGYSKNKKAEEDGKAEQSA
ncbi:TerC family protein [Falsibacillus pallidus]|uniref:YjbE family integral membrane protein n=1 Tax=Falsibacillus pallidus TaxID=493781 RepID=A0A370GEQ2_9BACI|nr:TerC family protein [Falsibacillus pallidus]RDI42288.1 YjbE family integral membrane protein [Falsibacillus pallidus]